MLPRCPPTTAVTLALLTCASPALADNHVAVSASARTEYTRHKFENDPPRLETYVFMQGKYFDGRRVDHSIERLSFRQIAEFLATELARQQYLPAADLKSADLVLVVHWGTTGTVQNIDPIRSLASIPTQAEVAQENERSRAMGLGASEIDGLSSLSVSSSEPYRAVGFEQAGQIAELAENDYKATNNAVLLGYTKDLRRLEQSAVQTTNEETLRSDLTSERYFIIIKAYDLKNPQPAGQVRRPVWTIHLNMRSPGQNFTTALARMGNAAIDYFGRNTDTVETVRSHEHTGTVRLDDVKILGEVTESHRVK